MAQRDVYDKVLYLKSDGKRIPLSKLSSWAFHPGAKEMGCMAWWVGFEFVHLLSLQGLYAHTAFVLKYLINHLESKKLCGTFSLP